MYSWLESVHSTRMRTFIFMFSGLWNQGQTSNLASKMRKIISQGTCVLRFKLIGLKFHQRLSWHCAWQTNRLNDDRTKERMNWRKDRKTQCPYVRQKKRYNSQTAYILCLNIKQLISVWIDLKTEQYENLQKLNVMSGASKKNNKHLIYLLSLSIHLSWHSESNLKLFAFPWHPP